MVIGDVKGWNLPESLHRFPITYMCDGERWQIVIKQICEQAGVNYIIPTEGESIDLPITVTYRRARFGSVLFAVARMGGFTPVFDGDSVSFRAGVRAQHAWLSTGYIPSDRASAVFKQLFSEKESQELGRGVFIPDISEEELEQAKEIQRLMGSVHNEEWVLSVWILEVDSSFRETFGIELTHFGAGALTIGTDLSSFIGRAVVEMTLRADRDAQFANLLTGGTLIVTEGTTSRLQNGETIPIPQRRVSPEGSVTTTGFTTVSTGLIIEASGRAVPGGFELTLRPELSSVIGFVEDHPRIATRNLTCTVTVNDGDWILLAGLDRWRQSTQKKGWWELLEETDQDTSHVLMVLRADRVGDWCSSEDLDYATDRDLGE